MPVPRCAGKVNTGNFAGAKQEALSPAWMHAGRTEPGRSDRNPATAHPPSKKNLMNTLTPEELLRLHNLERQHNTLRTARAARNRTHQLGASHWLHWSLDSVSASWLR